MLISSGMRAVNSRFQVDKGCRWCETSLEFGEISKRDGKVEKSQHWGRCSVMHLSCIDVAAFKPPHMAIWRWFRGGWLSCESGSIFMAGVLSLGAHALLLLLWSLPPKATTLPTTPLGQPIWASMVVLTTNETATPLPAPMPMQAQAMDSSKVDSAEEPAIPQSGGTVGATRGVHEQTTLPTETGQNAAQPDGQPKGVGFVPGLALTPETAAPTPHSCDPAEQQTMHQDQPSPCLPDTSP